MRRAFRCRDQEGELTSSSAALAILKHYGKTACVTFSNPVMDYTRQSVWQNPQIVRAAHHGLGRVNAACSGLALGAVAIRDKLGDGDLQDLRLPLGGGAEDPRPPRPPAGASSHSPFTSPGAPSLP